MTSRKDKGNNLRDVQYHCHDVVGK